MSWKQIDALISRALKKACDNNALQEIETRQPEQKIHENLRKFDLYQS